MFEMIARRQTKSSVIEKMPEVDTQEEEQLVQQNGHEEKNGIAVNNGYHSVPGTYVYIRVADGVMLNNIYSATKSKPAEKNDAPGDNKPPKYVPIYNWCPMVEERYTIEGASEGRRKQYVISVNGESHDCNESELQDGSIWSKFSLDTGTAGRANVSRLANVVKYIASITNKSGRGFISVGWHNVITDGAGEKKAYILDDGRGLDGTTYRVDDNNRKDWKKNSLIRMTQLPLPDATLEEAVDFIGWIYAASPRGHQALSMAAMFRSYLHDIVPGRTSFILLSKQLDPHMASRLGKTLIEMSSCNWIFRTYYSDIPHASFRSTLADLEKNIARQQSGNCVIDDLNIPPTYSEKKKGDVADKMEMIGRASYNGGEVRGRRNRNMEKQESSVFDLVPQANGELLMDSLPSLMRRMIVMFIDRGDIDIEMYKKEWESGVNCGRGNEWVSGMAYIMLKIGHMAMRNIEALRNTNDDALRYEIEEFEKNAVKRLTNALYNRDSVKTSQLSEDLPAIYARPLTGMWAAGRFAFDEDTGMAWVKLLYPRVAMAMFDQVKKVEGKSEEEDIATVASLIHLFMEHVSLSQPIMGTRYKFVDKSSGGHPSIHYDDGEEVNTGTWGYDGEVNDKVVAGYCHTTNDGTEVIYLSKLGINAILTIAGKHDEYKNLSLKDALYEALDNDGWINDKDTANGKRARVVDRVKQSGMAAGRYLELKAVKFITYISVSGVSRVRVLDSAVDQPVERSQDTSNTLTPNSSIGVRVLESVDQPVERIHEVSNTLTPLTPETDIYNSISSEHVEKHGNKMILGETPLPPHKCFICGNTDQSKWTWDGLRWHCNSGRKPGCVGV